MTAHASTVVPAPPDVVFAALTDIARLPDWNAVMTNVVDQPALLAVGSEWIVAFHALGRTWRSRSTVEELDGPAGASRTDLPPTTATPPTPGGLDGHRRPRRKPGDGDLDAAPGHVLATGAASPSPQPSAGPHRASRFALGARRARGGRGSGRTG